MMLSIFHLREDVKFGILSTEKAFNFNEKPFLTFLEDFCVLKKKRLEDTTFKHLISLLNLVSIKFMVRLQIGLLFEFR